MPKTMAIVRPLPISAITSTIPNATRLLNPDPKEAIVSGYAGSHYVEVDLGTSQSIDSVFLGFTNGPTGGVTVTYGAAAAPATAWPGGVINVGGSLTDLLGEDQTGQLHAISVLDTPVTARFVRFALTLPDQFPIGVVAVGKAFRPTWGHEYGAGRPVEDTGTADRLFGGGFGIEEGVRVGGYQWTLGDLTDAEVRSLYAIVKNRGTTRPTLVVEDPEVTVGLNDRTHWGLLDRLEPYERFMPGATRWSLRIRDWV